MPKRVLVIASRILRSYTEFLENLTRKRGTKPGKNRIFDCVRVFLSCHDNQVDPEVFVFSMFAVSGWERAPGFRALTAPWAIDRFKKREGQFLAEWGNWHVDIAPEVDGNLDLTPFGESLKEALPPEACSLSIKDHGGYHPLSKFCQGCPVAQQCASSVQRIMGIDMARLRAKPREEAVSVLSAMFDHYPKTPLTGGKTSAT